MRTFGLLRIIPSYELGALGPAVGEPVLYQWRWYYGVSGLALWVVLALAMVVPKANRTREVLLILVPVLLVNLIWLAVRLIFRLTTSDREVFGMTVLSLAVGSAVLWLLGHVIASCARYKGIVLALGIALGVAIVGTLSVVDVSGQTIALASIPGVLMPVVVLAYALAGRMSHRTYRPTRFLLLLAVGTVVFSTVGMLLWFLFGSTVSGNWPTHATDMLGVALVAGVIFGGCVFLVSLTFVFVGLHSPLFRPRLFACLRLPPVPSPAGTTAVTDTRKEG